MRERLQGQTYLGIKIQNSPSAELGNYLRQFERIQALGVVMIMAGIGALVGAAEAASRSRDDLGHLLTAAFVLSAGFGFIFAAGARKYARSTISEIKNRDLRKSGFPFFRKTTSS